MVEGEWSERVTGLPDLRVEIAMMRTPDGHGRLELSRFLYAACGRRSPERPGERSRLLRVMFAWSPRGRSPGPRGRRAAGRRTGPVRGRVSALIRPRPRGHSRWAGRADRLSVTDAGVVTHVGDTWFLTQLAPPPLHSPRVAPGLSLIGRRAFVARSVTETLDEAAQAAVQASDRERDQEAWNLPRAPGVPPLAGQTRTTPP